MSAQEQEIAFLASKHQAAETDKATKSRSLSQVTRDYEVVKAEVATLTEKLARLVSDFILFMYKFLKSGLLFESAEIERDLLRSAQIRHKQDLKRERERAQMDLRTQLELELEEQLRSETTEAQTKLMNALDSKATLQDELENMRREAEESQDERRRLREELSQIRLAQQQQDEQKLQIAQSTEKPDLQEKSEPKPTPQVQDEAKEQTEESFDIQDYLMHIENSRVVRSCT